MATRPCTQSAGPQDLDLYSWRNTRASSDVTVRSILQGVGKAADIFLTLIPALVAVLFILQAAHMAEEISPRESARIKISVEQGRR